MRPKPMAALAAITIAAPLGLAACTSTPEEVESLELAKGVEYAASYVESGGAKAMVHTMTVDLSQATVDVLYPGAVADAAKPTAMAKDAEAVGVVNGDFFNNSDDDHSHTDAPLGPMISGGEELSAAIPVSQKQGPARGEDAPMESVLGIAGDQATMTQLGLEGEVNTSQGVFPLAGLNQHAVAENGIVAFTSDWGTQSRKRALCGDDSDRDAECVSGTEVRVVDDAVVDVDDKAGKGKIADDEIVLLGREDGAENLAKLSEGDGVMVDYALRSDAGNLTAAVGGLPLVVDGKKRDGLDAEKREPRTAVGYSEDGGTLYMVVVDGRADHSDGASLAELAEFTVALGAHGVMNLDGGGSSVMGAAEDGDMEVRNKPTDTLGERKVGNALAVFGTAPDPVHPLAGRWQYQGDFPTDIQSLIIDESGKATYFGEGSAYEYVGELTESGDGYQVDLEPDDPMAEAEGFTFTVTPGDDDEVLVDNGSGELSFKRVANE